MKKIATLGFLFLMLSFSLASAGHEGYRYTFQDSFSSLDPDILDEGSDFYRKQFARQEQASRGISMQRNEALRELHYEYLLIQAGKFSGKEYSEIKDKSVPQKKSIRFSLQRNQRLAALRNEMKAYQD